MLFNSYIFILVFLPLCLLGYFGLNHFKKYKLAQFFLLVMSFWFYGYFNPKYLIIIAASIVVNYGVYKLIKRIQAGKLQKWVMILGVALNLGLLVYFKYMDFFIENVNAIFESNLPLLNIVLPLGISFYTFQQISFVVDSYRGEIPDYSFLSYASFVTFFPQLIAGPIVTHDELVPQFEDLEKKKLNFDNLAHGIYIFALGLAKKVLLADTFGTIVAYGYTTFEQLTSVSAFLVMLSYTFQIYFDFSGYCDMAVGIAKMMNIDLPVNFDSPYKALTIEEFWKRWHITLTRFFTKYVYIPLGGNRKGNVRTYVNVLIVFLLSGLWHGASWGFVFWGFCHGVFMMITRRFRSFFEKLHPGLNWLITFSFVNITWVFFRAESLSQAWTFLKVLFSWNFAELDQVFINMFRLIEFKKLLSPLRIETYYPPFMLMAFFLTALVLSVGGSNAYEKMKKFKPTALNMFITLFLIMWCVCSLTGISTFLYFNF